MRTADDPITINGSYGEGGGALLRTALCMSALTQRPLKIDSIRGATRKPGIAAEDLPIIRALSTSCDSPNKDFDIGDQSLAFEPKHLPRNIHFNYDISRSGSGRSPGNTLITAQTLAPILAGTGAISTLSLCGETHNNNTLTFDAFELSTTKAYMAQGLGVYPFIHQAGYGYAGRGKIVVEYEPSALEPVVWVNKGGILESGARITFVDMHSQVVADATSGIFKFLQEAGLGDEIQTVELSGPEPGLSITIWAKFENGFGSASASLNRGSHVAHTVEKVNNEFRSFLQSNSTVDPYLADQILLPACLAHGQSQFTTPVITRRLKTCAWVIKQFLPIAITIKGTEGGPGSITVQR